MKFVFEGEEEAGSPHLGEILTKNRELLRSDVWLICDGPVHQTRQQQIVFGARGIVSVDLTVYGPNRELHSGHYGNWAPNPAMMLARLLASMKDDDGRVTVARFYEGIAPLSDTEKRALAEAPVADPGLMRELALGRVEGGGKKLLELLNEPSLNIRGMSSARTGAGASNVIPSTATATIDMRLVKGITTAMAAERLKDHIRSQGYYLVENDPDAATRMAHPKVAKVEVEWSGYNASRTSMDLPISQAVLRAAEQARGPIVKLPTMGGSVPLIVIEDILKVPTITTPDRQSRQQSAQLQRKYPDSESVGRHRADGWIARDVALHARRLKSFMTTAIGFSGFSMRSSLLVRSWIASVHSGCGRM